MTSALTQLFNKKRFGSEPSAERCLALLNALSVDPTRINCIGITGSNGKGSTAIMLSAILTGHSYKTGLLTSPHFLNPNERFKVNGKAIPESELENLAREVFSHADRIEKKLTQEFSRFELLTILGFLYFKNEKVDIAILEAGIGGRLDPTKLAHSKLSAITSLELEHADILGDTLEKIFTEKLLLIDSGGLCYASIPVDGNLRESCLEIAKINDITLKLIDEECKNFKCHQNDEGTFLDLGSTSLQIPLVGNWQGRNLLMALTLAKKVIPEENFSVSVIQESLAQISIPGRFEKINSSPAIYIDSAHTPEAIREVVSLIQAREKGDTSDFAILLGILKDKSVEKMLVNISELEAPFFVSSAHQGGADPETLAKILKNQGKTVLAQDVDLLKVFKQAKNYAKETGATIYVLGGLSFAGDVRKIINGF